MKRKSKEILGAVVGSGDMIRVGDVFTTVFVDIRKDGSEEFGWRDPNVYRLLRVYREEGDPEGLGPHIEYIPLEGGKKRYPTTARAWNKSRGARNWRRFFVLLDQRDVEIWWAAARRSLSPGWHTIDTGGVRGKFRVAPGGAPVELVALKGSYLANEPPLRRKQLTSIASLAEQVGILTGYKLKVGKGETRAVVEKAVRLQPPLIHEGTRR